MFLSQMRRTQTLNYSKAVVVVVAFNYQHQPDTTRKSQSLFSLCKTCIAKTSPATCPLGDAAVNGCPEASRDVYWSPASSADST